MEPVEAHSVPSQEAAPVQRLLHRLPVSKKHHIHSNESLRALMREVTYDVPGMTHYPVSPSQETPEWLRLKLPTLQVRESEAQKG